MRSSTLTGLSSLISYSFTVSVFKVSKALSLRAFAGAQANRAEKVIILFPLALVKELFKLFKVSEAKGVYFLLLVKGGLAIVPQRKEFVRREI